MKPVNRGEPIVLAMQATETNHCFGCAKRNPAGLALELYESDDGGVTCDFVLDRRHESYPGIVHGGASAAVVDEVMGNLLVHVERIVCFTVTLRITYAGSLRIGHPYRATAWIKSRPRKPGDLYKVESDIRNAEGGLVIMARASFHWMSASDYRRALDTTEDPDPALMPFFRQD